MKCVYCNTVINNENKSKEHIIQNALGGVYESTNICCKKCNNIVERYIDDDFCKIFSPIITQIPQLKKSNKSAMPSCTGKALYIDDNTLYEVNIKNKKIVDCIQFKQKYRRNLTKEDLMKFKIVSYDFKVSDSNFKNGISKIAFNFAVEKGIPYSKLKNILITKKEGTFLKEINFSAQTIPFFPLNVFDEYLELETNIELYHNLILFSFENYLMCYIDLFNTFQFYVILSDSWDGPDIYEPYLQVVEKIDRKIPKFNIRRTKHILHLSKLYNVQPTYDIDKLNKDIKNVINKIPYEKEMSDYISSKCSWKYFNSNKDGMIERAASYLFYIDDDDKLIPKRFRIFTPILSNKTGKNSYYLYPDYIVRKLANRMNCLEYTYRKFERLTKFLNDSKEEEI